MKIVMTTRMYHYHQSVLVSTLLLQPFYFFEREIWRYQMGNQKERQCDGQKRTKKTQIIICTTEHRKLKIEQHEHHICKCFRRVGSSRSTSGARRVTVKRHEHHLIWKSWNVHNLYSSTVFLKSALLLQWHFI